MTSERGPRLRDSKTEKTKEATAKTANISSNFTTVDAEGTVDRPSDTLSGSHLVTVAIAIIFNMWLTIVATVTPRITEEFKSLDQFGWYSSVILLTVATTQGLWGKAFKLFLHQDGVTY